MEVGSLDLVQIEAFVGEFSKHRLWNYVNCRNVFGKIIFPPCRSRVVLGIRRFRDLI